MLNKFCLSLSLQLRCGNTYQTWNQFNKSNRYTCFTNAEMLPQYDCNICTRTTRTPVFWGYPPPPHDYPYHRVILDPKSKEDKVKVTNWKNSPKFQFWNRHHLLKLLDKMCKYEMDPMSIVEDTERTRFCPQTDRRTRWNQYTPFQLRWSGGYNNAIRDSQ